MRTDIEKLCVTTWGAVLEFKGWHFNGNGAADKLKIVAHIADPDAIDSGQFIRPDEIVLIARKKQQQWQKQATSKPAY